MGDERSIDSEFGDAAVAVADQSPNGTADHAATAEASSGEDVAESSTTATDATEGPDFLAQLAQAMQAAAGAERGRASEEIDRRSNAHIAAIRARAEAEALKMRDLAGDDRRAIERWAETEQQRIKAERDRRTKELEADLTLSLAEHGRQTDVQVQAVEAVVSKHRSDVDAFFTSLDGETDPVRFAQRAGQRPAFPDLDRLAAPTTSDATSEAPATATTSTAEPAAASWAEPASADPATTEWDAEPATAAKVEPDGGPVPVMDPVARLGLLKHSPEPSPFAKPVTAAAPNTATPGMSTNATGGSTSTPIADRIAARPDEPKAVATPQPQPTHSGPMGWLRRNNDGDK